MEKHLGSRDGGINDENSTTENKNLKGPPLHSLMGSNVYLSRLLDKPLPRRGGHVWMNKSGAEARTLGLAQEVRTVV